MPRPRQTDRPKRKEVSIPSSIIARFEKRYWDPLYNRVQPGAWSNLITRLLRDHLDELDNRSGHTPQQKEP